jgi:signal transduction histidine kinase
VSKAQPVDGAGPSSLRRSVNLTLGAVAVVLLLATIGGVASFVGLVSARDELIDELDPALTEAANLRTAIADQLGGARGYVLTARPDFRMPWDEGLVEFSRASEELESLLDGRREPLERLETVRSELVQWHRDHVEPLFETVRAGQEHSMGQLEGSLAQVTVVRSAIDELVDAISAQRAVARQEVDNASRQLVVTLLTVAGALTALIVFVAIGVRRSVLRPLEEMVDDASLIVAGDLDHVPATSGPQELVAVSRSLDHVRAELVHQLRQGEEREADLARSNAELEQFAYVASHDLQEPLRKVASFCQMLERRYKGQLDERADTYIAFAVDGAKRMQDLINDLLAFSRVGRTTERFESVDLDTVLDLALRNLASAIESSGTEIRRSPLPTLAGDRSLLVALFQNLIGNAIKFRGEDPPIVEVNATALEGRWEFTVSDNGIGIPEDYRDRVFVIFQRLHGRDEYAGTGIGLALCRKIVEFHGGRIDVDTPEGTGTTIRFTLAENLTIDAARSPQEAVLTP